MGDDDTHGPERQRLWFSLDRSRRFLVPEQLSLAEGGYPIQDPAGQQRAVDPAQLGNFEVSAAAADAWAKAELGRVLRDLGGNLRRSFASGPPPTGASPEAPVTPGLDLLAAITGTPRADLDAGGAVVEALRRYAADLGGTVAGAVSGDAARIASAQARMSGWAAALREHGTAVVEPGPAAGPAPAVVAAADAAPPAADAGSDPAPDPAPEATRQTTAGPAAASGIVAGLQALAEEFRRRADALAAARDGGPAVSAAAASGSGSGDAAACAGPSEAADTQAAALDALATGIEDVANDAAARLRAHAARLRRGG